MCRRGRGRSAARVRRGIVVKRLTFHRAGIHAGDAAPDGEFVSSLLNGGKADEASASGRCQAGSAGGTSLSAKRPVNWCWKVCALRRMSVSAKVLRRTDAVIGGKTGTAQAVKIRMVGGAGSVRRKWRIWSATTRGLPHTAARTERMWSLSSCWSTGGRQFGGRSGSPRRYNIPLWDSLGPQPQRGGNPHGARGLILNEAGGRFL